MLRAAASIVVKDDDRRWGFVANRVVLIAAVDEATRIVNEGLDTEDDVDTLLQDAFGWPNGVFSLLRGADSGWSTPSP